MRRGTYGLANDSAGPDAILLYYMELRWCDIREEVVEQKFGRLQGKKYVYIHNDLSNSAFHFKTRIEERLANDDRVGITFDCMACLVMCAFSFEAYINFLGSKLIADWKERQPFNDKVDQVLKHL